MLRCGEIKQRWIRRLRKASPHPADVLCFVYAQAPYDRNGLAVIAGKYHLPAAGADRFGSNHRASGVVWQRSAGIDVSGAASAMIDGDDPDNDRVRCGRRFLGVVPAPICTRA